MSFNIKNNYGPNIEVKEGGVLHLHQNCQGRWNTDEVEDAEVEDVLEEERTNAADERTEARVVNCKEKLSPRRQSIMDRLDDLIQRGEWVKPANEENIKRMMRDVLNQGEYALQGDELTMSNMLWNMLEHRKGDSVKVTFQNLIGFFIYNRYFPPVGSPKLQEMFFGSVDDYTNIDKGRPDRRYMPDNFRQILPLLDKYKPQ